MTSDLDLRDALSGAAAGPPPPAPGWDAVVRRGRRRQRVRRTRTAALAGLVVAVIVGSFMLTDDDQDVGTLPPATEPTAPAASTALDYTPDPPHTDALIARTQGAFVTLIFPSIDLVTGVPTGADLCRYHPLVTESPDQVLLDVVDDTVEGGTAWTRCQASTGTIELAEPLGDRALVNARSGEIVNEVTVVDSAPLLFPTTLPEPFDLERWDESTLEFDVGRSWTFSWGTVGQHLAVTNGEYTSFDCEVRDVEVRGTAGRFCYYQQDGVFDLEWEEGGRTIAVAGQGESRPESDVLADALVVAEGLEPIGG
jgi:hypothetical protein